MSRASKYAFYGVLVAAGLGIGAWKYSERSSRIYSDSTDPLRFVEENGLWGMTIHNTGPATDAVSFFFADGNAYCEKPTFFSEDERRVVENVCLELNNLPEGTYYYMVVLTLEDFTNTNWREVFLAEEPIAVTAQ